MSTLYLVATPIGNLQDITLRALEVLKSVDVIACEDTRHSSLLLRRYEIEKRLIATHAHNESESAKGIIELLDRGEDVAFISDAGTPGISDPGARLVEAVRATEHKIVPIPGASAGITLVCAAGNIGKTFTFEGFLSPKKGRKEKRLKELFSRGESFIIYESPFRVVKTLEEIASISSVCQVVIGRELTKQYEEISRENILEAIERLKAKPSIKGEFVIIVIPGESDDQAEED